jgi:hypothetical protein
LYAENGHPGCAPVADQFRVCRQLTQNNIRGTIPTIIGQMTELVGFQIDENRLVGTIPTEIGHLTSLLNM